MISGLLQKFRGDSGVRQQRGKKPGEILVGGANALRQNAKCRRQFSRCQRQECPRRHTRWLAPVSSSHQLYAGLPALEKIFHLPRGVENGTKRMKIETQSTRIYLQKGNLFLPAGDICCRMPT